MDDWEFLEPELLSIAEFPIPGDAWQRHVLAASCDRWRRDEPTCQGAPQHSRRHRLYAKAHAAFHTGRPTVSVL